MAQIGALPRVALFGIVFRIHQLLSYCAYSKQTPPQVNSRDANGTLGGQNANKEIWTTIVSDLLRKHIQTLVVHNAQMADSDCR